MGRDCRNSAAGRPLTEPPTFVVHGFVQLLQTVISRRRLSLVEPSTPARPQSRMLMPASLITGPHLSISDLKNCPSSVGVEPITNKPSCSSRALIVGSASAPAVSAYIFRTIAGGVLTGTKKAYHPETSKPVSPVSASVGKSGAADVRLAVVTASARNWPCCISDSSGAILLKKTSTRPGMTSWVAGAAPREGTVVISMPAARLNSSPARWGDVPWPGLANLTVPLFALA